MDRWLDVTVVVPDHRAMQANPIRRRIALPGRGGGLAGLAFGPQDRPVDLLFLHANGFNAMTYRHLLAPLGVRWNVLAVDQRGHGRSDLPTELPERRSWQVFADDLAALFASLAAPVVFAGHSMGATAGLLALAGCAERMRRLVLLDPVLRAPGPVETWNTPLARGALHRRPVFADRAEALASYRGRGVFANWPGPVIADYLEDGLVERPDGTVALACAPAWEAANFALHDHDAWAAFDRPHPPIRLLRAATGSTSRIEGREDRLAGVDLVTVPETTHFLPIERPEVVRAALAAALEADLAQMESAEVKPAGGRPI